MSKFVDIDEQIIEAPGFDDASETVLLTVSKSWLMQNAVHGRRHRLMEFWGLIAKERPPVNCIGYHEGGLVPKLPGLEVAHTLFRGIERPVEESKHGDDIYVYVCQPQQLYKFVAHMVCVAKLRAAPVNALFVCYVKRYGKATEFGISGMILSWEWVKPDPNDATLPEDHGTRYAEMMWSK